ncbi:unnamed protein product [Urochloa humidicola]
MAADSQNKIPPLRIVRYPDLVEKAWGWERLVPYDSAIDMPTYVTYLNKYYEHNHLEYIVTGNQKPEEWPLESGVPQEGKLLVQMAWLMWPKFVSTQNKNSCSSGRAG